jgi:hypothetical protein
MTFGALLREARLELSQDLTAGELIAPPQL